MTETFRLYRYRWVVLAVFMFVNLTMQLLWISYAPITGPAAEYYGVTDLQIGFFAMSFMAAFIPLSIPVSWVIDKYGFRLAVSIGAVMMGIFGIARGLAGGNYALALAATAGIAISQPFLLNAWTKMPAQWFSIGERATAVGIVILANLIGTAMGMVLTPILIEQMPIPTVQLLYGIVAAASAALFVLLARERPPTPPAPAGMEVRALILDGYKHAFTVRSFWLWVLVFFIGMGIFNGVTTWIEGIARPRGFTPEEAGVLGAVMLVGGILGAVIIPLFSDRQHRRKRYLFLGIAGAIPGVLGLALARGFPLMVLSCFVLGFFLVSTSPIGMQYAAEITFPTPEGTSNGLLQLFGQASVVFVYLMEMLRTPDGAFTPALLLATALLCLSLFLISRLKDPVYGATSAEPAISTKLG